MNRSPFPALTSVSTFPFSAPSLSLSACPQLEAHHAQSFPLPALAKQYSGCFPQATSDITEVRNIKGPGECSSIYMDKNKEEKTSVKQDREFSIRVFLNHPVPSLESGRDIEVKLLFVRSMLSMCLPLDLGLGGGTSLAGVRYRRKPVSERNGKTRWELGTSLSPSQIIFVSLDSATRQHIAKPGRSFFGDSNSPSQGAKKSRYSLLNELFKL